MLQHNKLIGWRFFRLAWLLAASLGVQSVNAQAVKEFFYIPDKIYPVYTGLGIATQIEIAPNEQVKDFGTGFTSAWDLARRENIFYLKPKLPQADTNMYIRTNQRTYLIDLRVTGKKWKTPEEARRNGVNYKVRFTYSTIKTNQADDNSAATPSGIAAGNGVNESNMYYAYDYATAQNSSWLTPLKIYDDGNFTYIFLKPDLQISGGTPAVFARKEESAEDFLVNSTFKGNKITVHGVYKYLVLRHGDNVLGLRRN